MPAGPSEPDRRQPGSPPANDAAAPTPLADRRIAVALSGGIACYKSATLVSRLAQAGADVRVLMTDAATRFVTPLTFQSLSGKPVLTSIWQSDDMPDSQHVGVARSCELLVIAPASADLIAKLAAGLANDVVCLVAAALPRETPVLLAPAMNAQMWESPITQRNLATLRDLLGWQTVGPDTGWQACRTMGAGRMSEAETIFDAVCKQLA
ncbi:flavoprotein [Phycisphaerales bacterium AB-hyl4]|uniref:Flavoprotein n=1 Tax=Natronomicrosphaera hydrolytica TaxID=3242702 RepID=A0ABV4U791_9BACT